MRWQFLLAMGLLVWEARVAGAQNFGGGPPFILPAQAPCSASPFAASQFAGSQFAASQSGGSQFAASQFGANRDQGRVVQAGALDFQPMGVRRLDPMLAAPMESLPPTWNGATLEYQSDDERDNCDVGPIPAASSGPMTAPLSMPGTTVYRPVTPTRPQPTGVDPTSRYVPITVTATANTVFGKGLLGQPKVYVTGQPIRNFFRYLTP